MATTGTETSERVCSVEGRNGCWAVGPYSGPGNSLSCTYGSLIFNTRREAQEVARTVNEAYRAGMAQTERYRPFVLGALADTPEAPSLTHWRVTRHGCLTGDYWLISDSAGDVALVMSSEASATSTCDAIQAAYSAGIARGVLSPINQSQEDAIDAIYGPRLVQP